jgi:hypothetical protein
LVKSESDWMGLSQALKGSASGYHGYQDPSLGRLLLALAAVSAAGPLAAVCEGDTAVGRTMEAALGIQMNSSKDPDWEGRIELKFGRRRPSQRKNLVARVPDWSRSPLRSSDEILEAFGYHRDGTERLYTEVNSMPNSLGLYLVADESTSLIEERSTTPSIPVVARWSLAMLGQAIENKHGRTCWITCDSFEADGKEHFLPIEVQYTAGPRTELIGQLINYGDITLDHLIKRTPTGRAHEKGPIWKVKPRSSDLFLPLQAEYELHRGDIRRLPR